MIPTPATCEQLRDFFEWHVQTGHAKDVVMLDKRGMEYMVRPHHLGAEIGLALPAEGESGNPDLHQIYLRAAFA